jgi:membrane protein
MRQTYHFRNFALALLSAFKLLLKNDPLRLAGATAFFTTFALPPILLLLIQLLSLIFSRRDIAMELISNLRGTVGDDSVSQVVEALQGFRGLAINPTVAIVGLLFLLFVSTTLFKVIQSSLNQVWMVRKLGVKRFRMAMVTRLKSTLVIIFTGILFIASLATESLQVLFGKYIDDAIPGSGIYLNSALSTLFSIIIVWTWFTVLFRYLPDGIPAWRVAMFGGLLTSILYNAGVIFLKWMLAISNIGAVYGGSASMVLLLLFVFYASMIFYFGAAFTKTWGDQVGLPIKPVSYAEMYENTHVQNESPDLPH